MHKPNFFGIGQTRGGTTFLYSLLKPHPEVFLSDLKESRFFNHQIDDPQRKEKIHGDRPVTLADYQALFEPVNGQHKAIGDISPQYLESLYAHDQIKAYNADAKIICTLRHPSDRMYSLYTMGAQAIKEPFIDHFRSQKDEWLVESAYSYRNLKKYFDNFPREHILLVRFEDLVGNTEQEKQRLAAFLQIDPSHFPDQTQTHKNASGVSKYKSLDTLFRRFRKAAWLRDLIPSGVESRLRGMWQSTLERPAALGESDRLEVMDFFREDTLKLEQLAGIELPKWLPENH